MRSSIGVQVKHLLSLNLVIVLYLLASFTYATEAPAEVKGAETIGVEEAQKLFEEGAVFIDVREFDAWQAGHIHGSVHLDFSAEEFVVLYVSDALDKATPVVFYCDSPLVNVAAMASFFASAWGYENVYFFRDGYYAWLAADYPVESELNSVQYTAKNTLEKVAKPNFPSSRGLE